ncbi:hypothetical protein [Oleiharenicola lentus]|uniref:hypothetical protein n=1 Tax=Oleiharenicola lentus TaxID=2508720 RepID=UPI003F669501
MANPKHRSEPRAVELLEEAVHLLRRNPLTLAVYYLGAAPFGVALLYAWARVTWFAPENGAIALGALGLAGLFGLMKVAQHQFARRLFAARSGGEGAAWKWRELPAALSAEFRLQAISILLLPVSALLTAPFGWAYAYFQSASVIGGTPDKRRAEAWASALLWPKQNHVALLMLSGLWLMAFINIAVAFYAVPMLATKFLGLKTIFAISGWSYFNTTLCVMLIVLTHLVMDPLIKAFYVLRIFHGRARRTGADLRLVLSREKQLRGAAQRVALVMFALILSMPAGFAAVDTPAKTPVPVVTLNRSIDEVLQRPEYAWRLRQPEKQQKLKVDGPVKSFFRATVETVTEIVRSVADWFRKAKRWVDDLFPGKDREAVSAERERGSRSVDWMAALQVVAYIMFFVVLGVLLLVAWRVWKHNRQPALPRLASATPAATPDLTDETVEASRLPTDGWLDLARQQIAAGNWRLALRALFLASLARLAGEGLVTLKRFKTNHDYERELRRRARDRLAVCDEFQLRRRQFEDTWYGDHPVEAGQVSAWLTQLEARP